MVAYTAVYIFGDSLVDAGNALKLAEWYGDLTFGDLPEGAPTEELGYFDGRFSDGYTFADLLSNKLVGLPTEPVFPFGFEDPWLGIPLSPFGGDPSGNTLNFAYGGAQIRQGGEMVPDLDGQTDAFRNAVDGDAPPGALYFFTIGGNDVRSLAKADSTPVPQSEGYAALQLAADKYLREISQLIQDGARHIMITGVPDVGLIPAYDLNNNLVLESTELARSAAATDYSRYLDNLIRTQVIPGLQALGAIVTYVPVMDYQTASGTVTGALNAILPTLAALHGLTPGQLSGNMLAYQDLIFFDQVHPNAQTHALVGAYMHSRLTDTAWVETLPLAGSAVAYRLTATIGAVGEIDRATIAMVAGTSYRFDMLGVSSLGTAFSLADPSLRLLAPGGTVVASDSDSGAGFDATFAYSASVTGNHILEMSASGAITGSYVLQAGAVSGAAMQASNSYTVNSASVLVLEGVGGIGIDVVRASVSYALAGGSEIEQLRTTNDRGKSAINLTGNDFVQEIIGNVGANGIDGKGGNDVLSGGAGNDRFIFSTLLDAIRNVDRITDFNVRDDTIAIDDAIFTGLSTGTLPGAAFALSTSPQDADDRIIYNRATGEIFFDADGSASAYAPVLFATVTAGLNLTAADFLVI